MRRSHSTPAVLVTAIALSLGACGGHGANTQQAGDTTAVVTPATTNAAPAPTAGAAASTATADSTTPTHHSKLAGAAIGAVAGHVVGGKKGAIAGAVIGAEIQHHRNKAYEKAHP